MASNNTVTLRKTITKQIAAAGDVKLFCYKLDKEEKLKHNSKKI
jgi:hypothetical protein